MTLPLLVKAFINDDSNIASGDGFQIQQIELEQKADRAVDFIQTPTPIATIFPTASATITVGTTAQFPGTVSDNLLEFGIGEGSAAFIYNTSDGTLIAEGILPPGSPAVSLVRISPDGTIFAAAYAQNLIDVFVVPASPTITVTATATVTAPCKLGAIQDFKITDTNIVAVNGRRLVAWNWVTGAQIIADKFTGGADAYDINSDYLVYLQQRCSCGVKSSVLKVVSLSAPATQGEQLIVLGDNSATSVILNDDGTADWALVRFSDYANIYVLPTALTPPQAYLYRVNLVSPNSTLYFSELPPVVDEVDSTDPTSFFIFRTNLLTGIATSFAVPKVATSPPAPAGLTYASLQIFENQFLLGGLAGTDKTTVYLATGTFPAV